MTRQRAAVAFAAMMVLTAAAWAGADQPAAKPTKYRTMYQCNACKEVQVRVSTLKYSGNQGVTCPGCGKQGAKVVSCEPVDD